MNRSIESSSVCTHQKSDQPRHYHIALQVPSLWAGSYSEYTGRCGPVRSPSIPVVAHHVYFCCAFYSWFGLGGVMRKVMEERLPPPHPPTWMCLVFVETPWRVYLFLFLLLIPGRFFLSCICRVWLVSGRSVSCPICVASAEVGGATSPPRLTSTTAPDRKEACRNHSPHNTHVTRSATSPRTPHSKRHHVQRYPKTPHPTRPTQP